LLVKQPGDEQFNHFVSVVRSLDNKTILAYIPEKSSIEIRKPLNIGYSVRWFDPVRNSYFDGKAEDSGLILKITSPVDTDLLLILTGIPARI
jgi:hypothetical protein